jgi:hypothetical protein
MHALISILPRTAGFWFVIAIFLFILVLVIRFWILSISKFNNWKKTIEKGQRIHDKDINAQLMIFLIWNNDFEITAMKKKNPAFYKLIETFNLNT